jgi:ferritin-like metal-binding protein YciE
MGTTKSTDTLKTYVGDMHALVEHGLQAIGRQVDNLKGEGHDEALQAVRDFRQTLQTHVQALDARMSVLGGSATKPVKDAISAVAGVAAGIINAMRAEEASKSLRDDYTFLSHCAVAYLMLHTTSSSLGDRETAELAERGYRDCARMIMTIDRIMPSLVLQELRQDGLSVTDISDKVRTMVRDAWRREAGPAGVKA